MQKNEAAALTPTEVAATLHATLVALTSLLGALPDAAARWRPAPGEWSIQETLGHLIETERRSFASRIREILAGPNPQFAEWDPDGVARERNDSAKELPALLAEFAALRTGGIALAGSLRPDDLRRSGRHPQIGSVSVEELLHEWVYHDCAHLRQMQTNVQDYVWPALGAAQKFYTPPPGS